MLLKDIVAEDFTNYYKASMFIIFPYCTFKCDRECGRKLCQNSSLVKQPDIEIPVNKIIDSYINNPITHAIVLGGLEPFDSFDDVLDLIKELRTKRFCDDDIVIYTGYNKEEILDKIKLLKEFKNIIIKFGRYIPDQRPHIDPILKVELASDNQYAEKL